MADATRVLPLTAAGRDPNVMGTSKLGERLGLTEDLIRSMAKKNEIPAHKVAKNYVFYYPAVMCALAGSDVYFTSAELTQPLSGERDPNVLKAADLATRWGVAEVNTIRKAHQRDGLPGFALGRNTILFYYPACVRWLIGSFPLLLETDISYSLSGGNTAEMVNSETLANRWSVHVHTIQKAVSEKRLSAEQGSLGWLFNYQACIRRLVAEVGEPHKKDVGREQSRRDAATTSRVFARITDVAASCQQCVGPRQPHYDHVHRIDAIPTSQGFDGPFTARGFAVGLSGNRLPQTWFFFEEAGAAHIFGKAAHMSASDILHHTVHEAARVVSRFEHDSEVVTLYIGPEHRL